MFYFCYAIFNDVLVALSIQRSIDVAATTAEVCGPSQVTIIDAMFDYDCYFSFL